MTRIMYLIQASPMFITGDYVEHVFDIEENDDEDISEHDERAKAEAEKWVAQQLPALKLQQLWRRVNV